MANKLIHEQSPYLLQHSGNPVAWYPWSDEPFEIAAKEHKPVLVSIGYAACHWCHVMEKESFEDHAVAAYMNEHFVCIKVDREEHPDVDQMYMDAANAISGGGGWPLNVFVTPGRIPFYAGTYYPPHPANKRPSWIILLQRMNEIWRDQQDEVRLRSGEILNHLQTASKRALPTVLQHDKNSCRTIADMMLRYADKANGGFGSAPKFPSTMPCSYLLEHYHFTGYKPALDHALLSLNAMIGGGIYDQLGGGIARYATDKAWLVPHFEKMLYDNALFITTLCDAFSVTNDPSYRAVIVETIDFVNRELSDASGGYYCALDADSHGSEGKFYTWTWDEWRAVIDEKDRIAQSFWGIEEKGNWEATNILHQATTIDAISLLTALPAPVVEQHINEAKALLLAERNRRTKPATDDKSLLSWNALMNLALTKAGMTLAATATELAADYIEIATNHMHWMLDQYNQSGTLHHTWKQGVARIPAKLDDYAYLVQSLLQLASASGVNTWIVKAASLLDSMFADFQADNGLFYYTSISQKDIPVRKVDILDGATPSANAVMAQNLWLCGMCMERTDWIEMAEQMLESMHDLVEQHSLSLAYWALVLQRKMAGQKTVICAGKNANETRINIQSQYLPNTFVLAAEEELPEPPIFKNKFSNGKTSIYICSECACLPPCNTIEQALNNIRN